MWHKVRRVSLQLCRLQTRRLQDPEVGALSLPEGPGVWLYFPLSQLPKGDEHVWWPTAQGTSEDWLPSPWLSEPTPRKGRWLLSLKCLSCLCVYACSDNAHSRKRKPHRRALSAKYECPYVYRIMRYVPKSGIADQKGMCIFKFEHCFQFALQRGCNNF